MCGLLRMSIRFSARTFMNVYHEFEKKFVVMRRLLRMYIRFGVWTLIERNPPPGRVSYLLCSLIKNRE